MLPGWTLRGRVCRLLQRHGLSLRNQPKPAAQSLSPPRRRLRISLEWRSRGEQQRSWLTTAPSQPPAAVAGPAACSPPPLPTQLDAYGACSVVPPEERDPPMRYENVDGRRVEDGRYAAFLSDVSAFIPPARVATDPVRTFAYGTDASFYRLNPRAVVTLVGEDEVATILPLARRHGVPVTFRAAGTSLSGQAITDSILLRINHAGTAWRGCQVHGDGSAVTVQPALIGGEVNRILAAHHRRHRLPVQYKLGPDPASIDSCMIGGIIANNASGMCCGVAQNSYHTIKDVRLVFADGSVLDTADEASRREFLAHHGGLAAGVSALAARVQADANLANLIRQKFKIKCTTGYSLNALVDFAPDDPIEIIKHLVVGSEGTLAFVSRATYRTVPEWQHKASAFVLFPDVVSACRGAAVLKRQTRVDAAELMDRQSLRQFEASPAFTQLVPEIVGADPTAAGLLLECRGSSAEDLGERMGEVAAALAGSGLPLGGRAAEPRSIEAYPFTRDPKQTKVYWDARKSLLPIVGGAREPGTTMLLEDVACPIDRLGEMTTELVGLLRKYGYEQASIFGHALEGNLHIVFSQGFRSPEEVARFRAMFDELMGAVATRLGGSLKGEHGTGRNVAPYVEMEWGSTAYELMWELKALFDPDHILNPGVILNRDPLVHLKHLKPSPTASPLVNACIECGYCESNCPSRDVTLTPRQRIAVFRELFRLRSLATRTAEQEAQMEEMRQLFEYAGKGTCAADGMCQEKCPVKINTGQLVKQLRVEDMEAMPRASAVAMTLADNFGAVAAVMRRTLDAVSVVHGAVGTAPLERLTTALNRASNHIIPVWNPFMPQGAAPLNMHPPPPEASPCGAAPPRVVYVPSCVTRIMGPARSDPCQQSVHQALLSLCAKAGFEVVYPAGVEVLCCGMMFGSRGFKAAADAKAEQLLAAVAAASADGALPVVCDTSPCLHTLKEHVSDPELRARLYEPVGFIRRFLVPRLEFARVRGAVAVHVPCSSKKMGLEVEFLQLASLCAAEAVPTSIPCCGMAGDRGMRYPELTDGSLQHLDVAGCTDGYSTSRTCEMGLASHSSIQFRGLVHLVDEATRAKPVQTARQQ